MCTPGADQAVRAGCVEAQSPETLKLVCRNGQTMSMKASERGMVSGSLIGSNDFV